MKYYQLRDDMTSSARWHLGEVTLPDGTEPRLCEGIRLTQAGRLRAPVDRRGRSLDFSLTSFAVPVATGPLAHVMSELAGSDLQCLPVDIPGRRRMMVLNVLRVVRCVDEGRSELIRWAAQDHRADLAGKYRQLTKLVLAPGSVPPDAHLFRVEGWLIGLIVSEAMKAAMERAGCEGAKFSELHA